ncbi:2-oxoacid:acceptor oxidoreductase subunit alpha [bacterium]|nr:2-oxoacid:acceptor oxidoreductase subunit alpha [bacterium]MBU1024651.1 2-oxoacid:acceptor oxidoreductase subunit alpha [bacterium]
MTEKLKHIKTVSADPIGVATGAHYLDGDHASAEGCIAAGCRFFAGYPITPATEIAERVAARFPRIGGIFIQMEDELASMNAILGAAWGGAKTMTCTSGPGFSLMMENFGLGLMLETPCVLTNVQRGGPSTGLPTLVAQSDMMQARWGSHGDYEVVALVPQSPQECFELTITAFNYSELLRMPILVMMDECVGHMTERVIIPEPHEIQIVPRRYTDEPPETYLPYKPAEDLIPPMPPVGEGYRFHITGLTHDEKGYPVMTADAQQKLVSRLINKVKHHAEEIILTDEKYMDDAEVVVMSYGITARVAIPAIEKARKEGINVGSIRLITVWPFPEKQVLELSKKVNGIVLPELNMGQIVLEAERCAHGNCKVIPVPHAGGWVHDPEDIYLAIKEAAK